MSVTASFEAPRLSPVTATLLVSCRDRTGLVAELSRFVFDNGRNIIDADPHADLETGVFFMRLVWSLPGFKLDRPEIHAALSDLAVRFDLTWELTYSDIRPRVAVLASKTPHCLYDLLLSHQLGEVGGYLGAVISNHDELRAVAGHFGVRFEHIPVDSKSKAAAEAALQKMLDELSVDLIVLARYMQILSPELVARWPGRVINIHHSFMPALVRAKTYPQGQARALEGLQA